jgi:hypothetical protein
MAVDLRGCMYTTESQRVAGKTVRVGKPARI